MTSATQKEYIYFKRNGHCFDLGSLAYNELVSEGKIPKKAKDPDSGLEYTKEQLKKDFQSDLEIANGYMIGYWKEKVDGIDELVNKSLKLKGASVTRDKVYVYFKRYIVNEYFKNC
tara:strand:- start:5313 stop:5660 length:348 start_codon:yes stop_codon:yes gene_type:complete